MSERVTFTTSDGVEIVGDWYPVEHPTRFAILLHIRPSTKESWKNWAGILNTKGVSCLAYDQRGHGESTMNGTLDFEKFEDDESRNKKLDLEAAFEWLKEKGAQEPTTLLMGASIGANLAIRFATEHADIPYIVALSPGINFRGVTTDDVIAKIAPTQKVILVASNDDPFDSFESCEQLRALAPDRTVFLKRSGVGHGTHMLGRDLELFPKILELIGL